MNAVFRRWTRANAAIAIAGALAIGGAIGSAVAIGPTVPAPVKWAGGWETNIGDLDSLEAAYKVPAGRNLLITDVILSNGGTVPVDFYMFSATAGSCSSVGDVRLNTVFAPARSTIVVPFTTGIGFASGQVICVQPIGGEVRLNMRGFLFTPAPAS